MKLLSNLSQKSVGAPDWSICDIECVINNDHVLPEISPIEETEELNALPYKNLTNCRITYRINTFLHYTTVCQFGKCMLSFRVFMYIKVKQEFAVSTLQNDAKQRFSTCFTKICLF